MRKIAPLCLASLLMISCVGIDSRLTVKDNGSGTLSLTYRISQLVTDLGVSRSGARAVPLPVSKEDFERSLARTGGKVRLTGFALSEDEKDITIHAELSFDSLEALSRVDAFRDADLKAGKEGGKSTFSQLVSRAATEPVSEDTLRMVDSLFDGYELTFVLETPRPILRAPLGTLTADKRTLTYRTSIKEVMSAKTDTVLSASW
jgi:hypothetical protein